MKKYVIVASVILTLAGCSASTATAQLRAEVAEVKETKQVSVQQQLITESKIQKNKLIEAAKVQANTKQMNKVIKYLKTRVGRTSYVFSGASPRGWDCSGLVRWTYERFGLELPHSANKQGHIGTRVSKPKLGDIVVFAYNGSTNFYHAAIYIGNGKIINAHYGADSTIIQPLTDYANGQIRFIRVVKTI
jgi:cell wall-associated NlpC family hydrolase